MSGELKVGDGERPGISAHVPFPFLYSFLPSHTPCLNRPDRLYARQTERFRRPQCCKTSRPPALE